MELSLLHKPSKALNIYMYVFAFYHPISYSSPLLLVSSQRISLACLVHYYCRGDDGVSTQSTMCHKNMFSVRSSCPDYDRYWFSGIPFEGTYLEGTLRKWGQH